MMKKTLITLAISATAALSMNAQAGDFKLVNGDGKAETQQCIDAVFDTNVSMDSKVSCNGMSMRSFVSKYRMMMEFESEKTIRVVTLDPQDSTFETALCVQAASTKDGLQNIIQEHGRKVLESVACNGKPIKRFAKTFKGAVAN